MVKSGVEVVCGEERGVWRWCVVKSGVEVLSGEEWCGGGVW